MQSLGFVSFRAPDDETAAMTHGLLTLFHRSMRVDARGVKGHAFRFAFAAFIYFSLLAAYLSSLSFGAPGLTFFLSICRWNLLFIGLAGMSFFATAITEEKEEATIGLLKMAGMSRAAILLGKSTSRLLSSILLLVIQFPFLLLAITLGGVTYSQVFAAAVTLLSFLAFTANVALLFSVVCDRSGSAVGLSAVALLARFLIPPLVTAAVLNARLASSLSGRVGSAVAWFDQTSPYRRLEAIMTTGFAEPLASPQVQFDLVCSVVCFAAAWLLFDRCTNEERAVPARRGPLLRRSGARRRFLSAGRPGLRPLAWKDFHFLAGGWSLLAAKFVLYGLIAVGIGFYLELERDFSWDHLSAGLFWAMVIALVIETAVLAARLFNEEWKQRTLDSLLLLPYSIRRLGWSKAIGVLPALLPAFAYLLAACIASPSGREAGFYVFLTPVGWGAILSYAAFLHLTALMSLYVRWGALPLSVLIALVAAYTLSPVLILSVAFAAAFGSSQAGAVPICGLQITLMIVLQLLIGKRIETLGGR